MDIVEMPQEDYSHDKEVEVFEKKYRMGGMGLVVEDMGYTYHTGTEVFKHASMQAFPHEVVALVGRKNNDASFDTSTSMSKRRPYVGMR